jgi:hypothetical protein
MKPSISPNETIATTIQTLRENAAEFNHVADLLEAREKFMGNVHVGIGSGPRLVKSALSTTARRKIAKAQKAAWAKRKSVSKSPPAKTAAA